VRVALYNGGGSANVSSSGYYSALTGLVFSGVIASVATLTEANLTLLTRDTYDVVVFPGGSGSEESAAIGADGADTVRGFVEGGGGYVGTCAGSYLAGHESCCSVPMAGYCGGATGCAASTWPLRLVDMGVAEPWDRGEGDVTIMLTDDAVDMLHLPQSWKGANQTILYWQGPVMSRDYKGNFTTLATFTTEIATKHVAVTKGQQIHTPALVTTTYGAGRVLLSSPHPEQSLPGMLPLVQAYVLYASRAI
jgi:glutamine amidotransferase-like uncharacterized protein